MHRNLEGSDSHLRSSSVIALTVFQSAPIMSGVEDEAATNHASGKLTFDEVDGASQGIKVP
jgi:hypothetical protein